MVLGLTYVLFSAILSISFRLRSFTRTCPCIQIGRTLIELKRNQRKKNEDRDEHDDDDDDDEEEEEEKI